MENLNEIELISSGESIYEISNDGVLELSQLIDASDGGVTVGAVIAADDFVPAGIVESDVDTLKNKIRAKQNKFTKPTVDNNRQIFQIASLRVELNNDAEIIRERGYYCLTENIKYYDDDRILKINSHLVKIPQNCNILIDDGFIQLDITENPLKLMDQYCQLIIEYNEELFRLKYDSYHLDFDKNDTNLFIDNLGNVTFTYHDEIAVINIVNDILKLGRYELNLLGEDRDLVANGKWIKLNRNLSIDGINGVLKMGNSKIKIPEDSYITSTIDGANIYLRNKSKGSVVQLYAICQGDYVEFRNQNNSIRMKKGANVIVDSFACIHFDYEGEKAWIDFKTYLMKLGEMTVHIYRGENIKVTGKWVYLNEVTSINPESQLVKYGRSKILVQGVVELFPAIDQLELKKKDKSIFCIPRHKQLFIRVGGKLIILTITVGIAIDQNGNLSFDHGGYRALLDTTFMILNIDSVKMNMGEILGICIEFIGNTVIVSTQDHERNFFELLQSQLSKGGIISLLAKLTQSDIDISELIDMILNRGGDIIKLLQEAGVNLDSAIVEKLQKLLGKNILSELMSSDGNLLDMNQLMCLSIQGGDLNQLMLGGQMMSLPSAEEIVELVLSSGGMESILAKIKGSDINLLLANS